MSDILKFANCHLAKNKETKFFSKYLNFLVDPTIFSIKNI